MSPVDIERLALALAIANGHSHPKDYASAAVENWKLLEEDFAQSLDEARSEAKASREK